MRTLFNLIALAALATAGARAGDITISLDDPNQSGYQGQTLQFFGTIYNASDTDTYYLNSDDVNVIANAGDFSVNDLFFTNVPVSLAPDSSSGDIELFDVTVGQPFADAFTTYSGTYALFGGNIGPDDQNNLAQTDFSVTALAPEPASLALFGTGLALIVWQFRRRSGKLMSVAVRK